MFKKKLIQAKYSVERQRSHCKGKKGTILTSVEKNCNMWLNTGFFLVWNLIEWCLSQILLLHTQIEPHIVMCAGQKLCISEGIHGFLRVYCYFSSGLLPLILLYPLKALYGAMQSWNEFVPHPLSFLCFPRVHDVHCRATVWEVGPVYRRYPPIWKYAKPSQEEQGQVEELAPQATQQ